MNHRRRLMALAGIVMADPCSVFAQSKKPPALIGWLHTDSRALGMEYLGAFKDGLAALGIKEGSQIIIDDRWADGRLERMPSLSDALAAKKPWIIVAGNPAAVRAAAKSAPNTAIVMASGGDPVAMEFAQSLARPGGMITGVASLNTTLAEKYLELLLAQCHRP